MPSRLHGPVAAPESDRRPRPRRSGRFAVLFVLGALVSAGTWAVPSAWAIPLLSLDKEATLDLGVNGTLEAGDEIDYEFTITNIGTVLLNSLDLDDALLGLTDATCGATSLLPLVATSCTASYELSQGDIDAGVVANVAEVCAIPLLAVLELCDTDSTSTVLDAELVIDLEKEATLDLGTNGTLEAGDELVFDFTIGNLGNVTLSGIDLDDDLLNLLGVTCGGSTLLPFLQLTCSSTYTLTQADIDAGSVSNIATVCADPPLGLELCDTDSTLTLLEGLPLLDLDKDAVLDLGANGTLEVGDEVDYTFTLQNLGNVTLAGLDLDDPSLGLADAACGATSLLPLATTSCTASHVLDQADLDAGSVANLADACADPPLGLELCDSDTTTTLLSALPLIDLDKSATLDLGINGTLEAGDEIDYDFTITNIGQLTLESIDLDDPLVGLSDATCGGVTTLLPLLSTSCSATYTLTQADLDAGSVPNLADVCSLTLLGAEVCDADSTETLLDTIALVHLDKDAVLDLGGNATLEAGDGIDYTFTITNVGSVTLSGLDLDDDLLDLEDVLCGVGDLLPLVSTSCTGTYVLTQADIDAGSVANLATVCALPPVGLELCDTDTTETQLDAAGLLSLDKSAVVDVGLNGTLEAGDEIHYTFTISNVGGLTLSGLDLDDALLGLADATCESTLLAPLLTATCTGTYVLTEADITLGSVANLADACADLPVSPVEVCAIDDVTTLLPLGASVTITKVTDPPSDSQLFSFALTGLGLPGTVELDTDAGTATPSSVTFELTALQLGGVSITESAVSGWLLTDLDCTEGLLDLVDGVATLVLDGGDDITCTFTNTRDEPDPTEPPITEPPATEPPVTEPPVTDPPATEPPVTEPPATEPPVTAAPSATPFASQEGATDAPPTDPPATQPGATEAGSALPSGPSVSSVPSPSLGAGALSEAPTQPDTASGLGARSSAPVEYAVLWILAISAVLLLMAPRRPARR